MLDIIIISYNGRTLTDNCIQSILNSNFNKNTSKIGIIVVDNNSNDDTIEYISKKYPDITIIKNEQNLGYSAAVNQGMQKSTSDYAIVTNNDVEFIDNSIDILYNFISNNKNIGLAIPQQFYPNNVWQKSYGDFSGIKCGLKYLFGITLFENVFNRKFYKPSNSSKKKNKKIDYADGAVLMLSKKTFNDVGGFDQDYFFYAEDMDYSYKLKLNNYDRYIIPKAIVYHHRGGSSRENKFSKEKQEALVNAKLLFCKKHLSSTSTHLYIKLEQLHHLSMLFLFSFINKLKETEHTKIKQDYYKLMYLIWKTK